jgi:hypothetical protein
VTQTNAPVVRWLIDQTWRRAFGRKRNLVCGLQQDLVWNSWKKPTGLRENTQFQQPIDYAGQQAASVGGPVFASAVTQLKDQNNPRKNERNPVRDDQRHIA